MLITVLYGDVGWAAGCLLSDLGADDDDGMDVFVDDICVELVG
jgi:hypothetical protein